MALIASMAAALLAANSLSSSVTVSMIACLSLARATFSSNVKPLSATPTVGCFS